MRRRCGLLDRHPERPGRVNLQRRNFLGGLGALLVAPSVVRAASLMPVSNQALGVMLWGDGIHDDTAAIQRMINLAKPGAVVQIPAGNFRLTGPMWFRPDSGGFQGVHRETFFRPDFSREWKWPANCGVLNFPEVVATDMGLSHSASVSDLSIAFG